MKKILYIAIAAIVIVQLNSCSKDYLQRPPLGIQDANDFYSSPGGGFKAVTNCYLGFYQFWNYQAALAELGNMATDDCDKGGSDAGDRPFITDLGDGRALSSNTTLSGFWTGCYQAIGNCNDALDHMVNAKLLDNNGNPLDAGTQKHYIAEIRFLRAFFYFKLVEVFGGVPLVTQTPSVADRNNLKRASADSVFNFIVNEWTSIIPDLPTKAELPSNELGRVTQEAVWAMLARTYLFFARENNALYAKARDAAKEVINSGVFALDPNYQDLWLPNGYQSSEPVFEVIFGDNPGAFIYGSDIPIYCSPRSTGGWGFDCPTQNLVNAYEKGDPRELFTILNNGDIFPAANGGQEVLDFSVSPNTGYYNRKVFLTASQRGPYGWGNNQWTLYVVRYSDVLLMYAEALLNSGGSHQEVADYINMVRSRASNSSRTDAVAVKRNTVIPDIPLPPVKPTDDLMAAIQHERRVEFGGEYHRLFDLIRWGTYVSVMQQFSTEPYANGKGASFTNSHEVDGRYVFPIPQTEIDLSNGSITQNPGY